MLDEAPIVRIVSNAVADKKQLRNFRFGAKKSGNIVIKGDNLLALQKLQSVLSGQVRCIYIDPPYNNQERYTHYRDAEDHSSWLSALERRLHTFWDLLTKDGSIWISLDDRGMHYAKVLADSIFGRKNFLTTIVWQQRATRENRRAFSNNHEYLLVYAKDPRAFTATRNRLPAPDIVALRYRNPDNDPRGLWQSVSANVQAGHATPAQFYTVCSPNGRRHDAPKGRCWVYSQERMKQEIASNNVWFGSNGNGVPRLKRFLASQEVALTPQTLWLASEVGTTDLAKKHLLTLFPDTPLFDTPKPEQLIHRVLSISTNPGDLVLDAYLGSGTTAAVAHKIKRRYVGIEIGEHAISLCAERLRRVIDGEQGGISRTVEWRGGGGFDFLELGRTP